MKEHRRRFDCAVVVVDRFFSNNLHVQTQFAVKTALSSDKDHNGAGARFQRTRRDAFRIVNCFASPEARQTD